MKGLGGFPDSLLLGPQSGGAVRPMDKGTLGCGDGGAAFQAEGPAWGKPVWEEAAHNPESGVRSSRGCQSRWHLVSHLKDFGVCPGAVGSY